MSLKKQAINGIAWSIFDKLFNQLGYLAITVYLARLIGPESFGLIGILTIFMLLAQVLVNGGFTQALIQRSHQLTEADASTIFYVNMVWSILIYILLYVYSPWIADFFRRPELVTISRLLFLVIIINSLTIVVRAKLIIQLDFKSQSIAGSVATILSAILAVFLAQNEYNYWALVWLILSRALFVSIGIWLFCRWLPQWKFSMNSFHALFKFGSNLMLAGFVSILVNNLYIALIGRFYDTTQVGYFTQANNLSSSLSQFITSSLQSVTYPILTSLKEDKNRLVRVYKQLISITMLISLPILVGFSAISEDFVRLFLGKEWMPVVPVLMTLSFARTITPISAINLNILNAIGRSDLFLRVDLFKLPMMLGALFIALPYGVEGISWAIVCTSFVSFFINAYYPGKLFGYGALSQLKVIYKLVLAVSVMFFAIGLVSFDNKLLELAIKIFFGIMVYVIMLYVLRVPLFLKFIESINKR